MGAGRAFSGATDLGGAAVAAVLNLDRCFRARTRAATAAASSNEGVADDDLVVPVAAVVGRRGGDDRTAARLCRKLPPAAPGRLVTRCGRIGLSPSDAILCEDETRLFSSAYPQT